MTKRFTNQVKKGLALFSTMLFFSISVLAQNQVSGTITDAEDGSPLPGVSIILKGTTNGTITDANGSFSISASSSDILVFSYIGYAAQEVTVGNQTSFSISLATDATELQELVVTGYSVDSRRETTGSVATIKPRAIQVSPSGNIEQQLQGRVAGVTVITNGQPGTSSQVRIRGYGALGGNEPMYVVDGVPVFNVDFLAPDDVESITVLKDATAAAIYGARGAGGVIVYTTKQGERGARKATITYDSQVGFTAPGDGPGVLNPQEQADWTWNALNNVNPGSASHPQYGSGATPVLPEFLLVGGASGVTGGVDLNAQRAVYNIDPTAGGINQTIRANKEGTDWYDAITRTAFQHRHNLGISGGGEGSRYYVGLNYFEQEGIVTHQELKRYSLRANTEFDIIPDKLRVGQNAQVTYRQTLGLQGSDGGRGSADDENIILTVSRMAPIIPVFDEFGGYAGTAAPGFNNAENPVANLDGTKNDRNFSTEFFGNGYLEFEPIEDLVFKTLFGGRYQNFTAFGNVRRTYENSENNSSFGFNDVAAFTTQWNWTNTVSYKKTFGPHSVGIMVGQEALNTGGPSGTQNGGFSNTGKFRFIRGSGLDPFSQNGDFVTLSTVGSQVLNGGHGNGSNFSSLFARATYDYDSKYLATFVIRRDKTSILSSKERSGTFPAFSLAWRLSEESFMSGVSIIDDLKIRGGWGQVGNVNNVNPSNQFSLFGTSIGASSYDIGGSNSSASQGFFLSRIGNASATWETSETINIGFDALLLDGKVDVILDYWRKTTDDLLFEPPVTTQRSSFAAAPSVNVGKMRNKGVDLKIVTKGNINAVGYEVTVNGSFLDNEIVKLAPGIEDLPNNSIEFRGVVPVLNQINQPLSSFFGFDVQGIFENQAEVDAAPTQAGAAPGRFRFKDINGDGNIDLEDRTAIGNPVADFTGGLTIKLNYQNFELEMYGFASIGNEIFNISKVFTDFYPLFPGAAISSRVKNSWTPSNTNATIPIFENVSNFSTNTQASSFFVEDGSYFRMQNITLSYYVPSAMLERMGMSRLKVSASTNNLFTITGYDGLDPGVGGAVDTSFGVDVGNFPVSRSYLIGVGISF